MKFTKSFAIASMSIVALVTLITSCGPSQNTDKTTASGKTDTSSVAPDIDEKGWKYSEEDDKMTSKKTFYAQVDAKELLEFKAPYSGGATATLTIRNRGGENDVFLSVTTGQMLTTSFQSTSYRVRFDDQPLQNYEFVGPSDNSTTLVFVNNATKFIKNLKKAKKVILEIEFFQEGLRPIEFNVADLKWNH